ncbi:L-fucose:H+ symporter permease [Aeoliella sp. ICT_H6.2]|uniref:L-fucose:H+ symporter permease n=1 Tax=Aeoliella straminimaris TaxID=2954799 RepID=A0A9X2FJS8_9BACT|nr:L-fucose:H+ symporter permease [Aeoliella straminimaris]MCO6047866.1 L-fucose:H+ symporter permease [Aeoliella straminimaris]
MNASSSDSGSSAHSESSSPTSPVIVARELRYPFILVTSLFALWGFANDVTNPMVKSFQQIFQLQAWQGNLVQFAFYGGYATMAIPAALVIRKVSFKAGIVIGLILAVTGALLFIPASISQEYWLFLGCFYVITFGLAFLETSANPYILSMGDIRTATRRLNLAQAFNPVGSLTGMFVAAVLVLPHLEVNKFRESHIQAHPEYKSQGLSPGEIGANVSAAMERFSGEQPDAYADLKTHDLGVIRIPYIAFAFVSLAILAAFLVSKMPHTGHTEDPIHLSETLLNLATFKYIGGVLAQGLYVGAQIMCWTNIIEYGMSVVGIDAPTAQWYNIGGMVLFLLSRFVWTYVLGYVRPGKLLANLAIGGLVFSLGTVFLPAQIGILSLICVSSCMAAMFPTIYGIALDGLSVDDAKLGSAGLIFAIVGGALMPPLQGYAIDVGTNFWGDPTTAVRASFLLPAASFIFVAVYGFVVARTGPRVSA